MALELQLKKTTGIFYGELMSAAGTSLPNGKYTTVNGISEDLWNNGLFVDGTARDLTNNDTVFKRVGTNRREIWEELLVATHYGPKDNILTGIQRIGYTSSGNDAYTLNPWKEITGGESFYSISRGLHSFANPNREDNPLIDSPKAVVEKIRKLYALFLKYSQQQLYDAFLREIDTNCDLHLRESPLDMPVHRLGIIYEILKQTPEEHRKAIAQVLRLLAGHNICVDKGKIVRSQIEHLVAYPVEQIPPHWEQGHLDEKVIAEKREEVNMFLHQNKRF